MLITITNEEKINVTLAPLTAAGNPANLDGAPTWTVTEGDATITPAEDGLSCTLISGAADVNSKIEVTADADLGEGVVALTDIIDLAVVTAQASALGLVTGEAELKDTEEVVEEGTEEEGTEEEGTEEEGTEV